MKPISDVLNNSDLQSLDSFGFKNHGSVVLAEQIQLSKGKIHEAQGDSADMFAVLVAAHLQGPVIWIGLDRDIRSLAPTALQTFLDPARFIMIEAINRMEILWAAEQAMRTNGVVSVIVELKNDLDLNESRRLQIAAEQSGCLGVILIGGKALTSAAETRWQCCACPNNENAWLWRLSKNKKGELSTWRVTWAGDKNASGVINLVAAVTT